MEQGSALHQHAAGPSAFAALASSPMASPQAETRPETEEPYGHTIPLHAMTGNQNPVVGAGNESQQDAHVAAGSTASSTRRHEVDEAPPPRPYRLPKGERAYGGPPTPPPHISFQYNSAATIERIPYNLQFIVPRNRSVIAPTAVAIGPYHRALPQLSGMQEAKSAAVAGFCRVRRSEGRCSRWLEPLAGATPPTVSSWR